ncbi:hypothetical protein QVD17_31737 [Tagetes erecta]|uniref:Uncharacterized protein n=1 Tax=Tagetes erecta TaxID=13708 RepID=A0AAD8K522_TARER|nr:hypothetical protein QVD17_31737 [Tagetes erecta]
MRNSENGTAFRNDLVHAGFLFLLDRGFLYKSESCNRGFYVTKIIKHIKASSALHFSIGCMFQDVSNICEVSDHQEVFVDPERNEHLERKHDLAYNGSDTWFLQDLAIEQGADAIFEAQGQIHCECVLISS